MALVIAEYQCDVLYRRQKLALAEFLPLDAANWIVCANALRLDWLSVCPPTGTGVKLRADDHFSTPLDQAEIDFENEGGETYICGNPPYKGSQWQNHDLKSDLKGIFETLTRNRASLDYVSGWFLKAARYANSTTSSAAFVSTNSICQGRQVETLWPLIFESGQEIKFAHTSFKWANLASHNAGVTVVIVGIASCAGAIRNLFTVEDHGVVSVKSTANINAYLAAAPNIIVEKAKAPRADVPEMSFGSMPNDGGLLLLDAIEAENAVKHHGVDSRYIRPFLGSKEFIRGIERRCIWVSENEYASAARNEWLKSRFESVRRQRAKSERATTKQLAALPFRFGEVRQTGTENVLIIPSVFSESREYLPVGYCAPGTIVSNLALAIYNAPLWSMSLIASHRGLNNFPNQWLGRKIGVDGQMVFRGVGYGGGTIWS